MENGSLKGTQGTIRIFRRYSPVRFDRIMLLHLAEVHDPWSSRCWAGLCSS